MRLSDRTIDAFFSLLRAGLWEQSVRIKSFEPLDFDSLYQLAEDQSIVGLLASGLEHVEDRKISKPEAIPFLKKVFALESRNVSMNSFIEGIVLKMREAGICALLVKGQGVAQCYEKPLWRASGDVDFLLNEENYELAKSLMTPMVASMHSENGKHVGMTVDSWMVELHGDLCCGLSSRMDKVILDVQKDTFLCNRFRTWKNGDTDVLLPSPNDDVIFIFTHILKHFYKGGIGLRQICDWCRLLWTYRESIDISLLESRLREMGLLSEWKAFAAFAVDSLGIPKEAMPLYDSSRSWSRKALRIRSFILKVGNFGKNRDMSYYARCPYLVRKAISFERRIIDAVRHSLVFPLDSLRFFPFIMYNGLKSAIKGK